MKSVCTLILSYIFSLLAWLVTTQASAGEAPIAQVITQEVRQLRLGQQIKVNGVVQSRYDLMLSTNIEGELLWVHEPGTWIPANSVVAKVDDAFLNIEISEQELLAQRADINVRYLQGEVNRLHRLEKSNMASQTQMAEMTSRRDLAKNEYRVALTRISRLKEQLKRTEIVSPVDGILVTRFRQGGEFARRGEAVARIVDPFALQVRAAVPLLYLSRLQVGTHLDVKIGDHQVQGWLRSIVDAGDETSQTFEVYIDINKALNGEALNQGTLNQSASNQGVLNQGTSNHGTSNQQNRSPVKSPEKILNRNIVDGQFAEVMIPLGDKEKSLLVPRDALVLRADGNYVFQINENNQARRVSVVLGEGQGDLVAVTGDLQPGDQVAVRGVERLTDGQLVKPGTG